MYHDLQQDGATKASASASAQGIMADPLVFLNDKDTFSSIDGSAILLGNYDRAYDINKMFKMLTPEQLAQCEIPVAESMVDAANEDME